MAMFLPSLIAPWIISRIGIYGLIALGLVAMFTALIVSSQYFSVDGFWLSLVLLGIGWNFMFVGDTSLLALVYRDGEQFTVQALNDGLVFQFQPLHRFHQAGYWQHGNGLEFYWLVSRCCCCRQRCLCGHGLTLSSIKLWSLIAVIF
tara:strand:- start:124 stop:564 length:441 start_codon:yes stop_codon:yes gene_type:complete